MPRMMREPEFERRERGRKEELRLDELLGRAGFSIEQEELTRSPTEKLHEWIWHPIDLKMTLERARETRMEYGAERPESEVPRKPLNPMEEYGKVAEWIKKGNFPGTEEVLKEIVKLPRDDPVRQMLVRDMRFPKKSFDYIAEHIGENFKDRSQEEVGFLLWSLNRAALDGPVKKIMYTTDNAKGEKILQLIYQLKNEPESKVICVSANMSGGGIKVEAPVLPDLKIEDLEGEQKDFLFKQAIFNAFKDHGSDRFNLHVMFPGEKFRRLEEAKELREVLGL